jgi:hypothetical protein
MFRKIKSAFIFILLLICPCILSACKIETVSSISMASDAINSYAIGEFSYADYKVKVSYNTEKVEEIDLTADMISDEDELKLLQEGEHTITVSYKKQECSFKVKIERNAFKNISFDAIETTYTGESVVAELSGDIPEGAEIIYSPTNSFVNAGEYEVSATISCENYATKTYNTTVKILKASYDMSNVKFEDVEDVYTGAEYGVFALNLPKGVSVEYFIEDEKSNTRVDAGNYTVVAKFSGDIKNYEAIEDMTASLKINKATHNMSGVKFENKTSVYDGSEVEAKLNDESLLPSGVSVIYNNNRHIDAGEYTAVAKFVIGDSRNYEQIEDMTATISIAKSDFDLSDVEFFGDIVQYDGNVHKLKITGQLPMGVEVEYENNEQINAGTYTVIAKFVHNNKNYNEIPNMTATLQINKIDADISNVAIDDSKDYEYQGSNDVFAPTGLKDGQVEVDYYSFYKIGEVDANVEGVNIFDPQYVEDNSTDVSKSGWYIIIVTFKDTVNYNTPNSIRKIIKINVAQG